MHILPDYSDPILNSTLTTRIITILRVIYKIRLKYFLENLIENIRARTIRGLPKLDYNHPGFL